MLVGEFPFGDQKDLQNLKKIMNVINFPSLLIFNPSKKIISHMFILVNYIQLFLQQIMLVQYKIPDTVHMSQDCRNLLSRIFVANPMKVCI